jgi:hypothetical protein
MSNNSSFTAMYEDLPKIAKILLQIFLGSLISGVYRILRYVETKNIVTLVVGILCFVGLGFVFWIVDLVTEITKGRITVLAE